MAGLPDSILMPPENVCGILDDSGITLWDSFNHIASKTFSTLMQHSMILSNG